MYSSARFNNTRSSFHDRVNNAGRATDLNRGPKDYEPESKLNVLASTSKFSHVEVCLGIFAGHKHH